MNSNEKHGFKIVNVLNATGRPMGLEIVFNGANYDSSIKQWTYGSEFSKSIKTVPPSTTPNQMVIVYEGNSEGAPSQPNDWARIARLQVIGTTAQNVFDIKQYHGQNAELLETNMWNNNTMTFTFNKMGEPATVTYSNNPDWQSVPGVPTSPNN